MVKTACNAGDVGSIPGLGISPGEGNGNSLQFLAWKISWTEEPGGLQPVGLQTAGHDCAQTHLVICLKSSALGHILCSQASVDRKPLPTRVPKSSQFPEPFTVQSCLQDAPHLKEKKKQDLKVTFNDDLSPFNLISMYALTAQQPFRKKYTIIERKTFLFHSSP